MIGRHTVLLTMVTVASLTACAGSSNQGTTPTPIGTLPPGSQTFTDATYRYEIQYPSDLALLPETPPTDGALTHVRFQDKSLIGTIAGELEPPKFAIEVFDGASVTSLMAWLQTSGRIPAGATVTTIAIAGAREGRRVQLALQLAPNDFYYVATDSYIYQLVPLGTYGPAMLASFKLK